MGGQVAAREVRKEAAVEAVCGLDVGDRKSSACVLTLGDGEVVRRAELRSTAEGLRKWFGRQPRMRVVLEVGTHSPWISRLLEGMGHEVVVASPRGLFGGRRGGRRKRDEIDAELLARASRSNDLKLLRPVEHRDAEQQVAMALVRGREAMVRARGDLINHCRGAVKALGHRLPACDARSFASKAQAALPVELRPALEPLVETIGELTRRLRQHYDAELERIGEEQFPETALLRQVRGVGPVTALTYVLVVRDPKRFRRNRAVGAYLGLVPGQWQSGDRDPQLRISKQGDRMLRRLLVQCAHYMLGPFGEGCWLRGFGERLIARGGRHAKRRAVVAVARRLSVLLLSLWRSGEVYDPWHGVEPPVAPEVVG